MANKEWTQPMKWDNAGIAPSETLSTEGFKGGDKPPAGVFNYFLHQTEACIAELQTEVDTTNTTVETNSTNIVNLDANVQKIINGETVVGVANDYTEGGGIYTKFDEIEVNLTASNSQLAEHGTKLDTIEEGAEVNQNAFSTVNVAGKKLSATSKTDSLAINAGTNVSISADELSKGMIISATDTTYENATTTKSGLMSDIDKTKLDTIEEGAQVNTVTSVAGKTGDVTLDNSDVGLGNVANVLQYSAQNKVPLSTGVTGTLPVANGGTGATDGMAALTNLVNDVITLTGVADDDYIIYQSNSLGDVLKTTVADFKTALGIGEPYVKTLNSTEWIETASSSDTTIAAMADFGKYCYKIAATTHNKGVNPIVQMRYVRPFNTVGHFVNISSNSIVDGDGNVYIFSNNTYNAMYMYSVIIR